VKFPGLSTAIHDLLRIAAASETTVAVEHTELAARLAPTPAQWPPPAVYPWAIWVLLAACGLGALLMVRAMRRQGRRLRTYTGDPLVDDPEPDEQIAYRSEGSQVARLAQTAPVLAVLAVCACFAAFRMGTEPLGMSRAWVPIAVLIATIWLVLRPGKPDEIVVTTRRLISRRPSRRVGSPPHLDADVVSVPLENLERIAVEQGGMGRRFNYGTLVLVGTDGSVQRFHHVSSPCVVRNKVLEGMAASAQAAKQATDGDALR